MAKTNGPLLSLQAHGSLGKILNYSQRTSGSQCRGYYKPTKPATPTQRGQRRLTEFLVAQWQGMTDLDQAAWKTAAEQSTFDLSGYHYFLRSAQRNLYEHHGLCGYWSFNKIVEGEVLDISGQNNNGSLDPNDPVDGPQLVTSKNARFSNALNFRGVSTRIYIPANDSLDFSYDTGFALTAWCKTTHDGVVVGRLGGNPGINANIQLRVYLGKIYVYGRPVTGNADWSTGTLDINDDVWHSLILNKTTTALEGWVDGKLECIDDTILGTGIINTSYWTIGNLYNMLWFNGLIDEVCIYKRPLTSTEIETRYKFATAKIK